MSIHQTNGQDPFVQVNVAQLITFRRNGQAPPFTPFSAVPSGLVDAIRVELLP